MIPASGDSNPAISRNSVVLPQPEGPKIPKHSPLRTSNESPLSTKLLPKRFVKSSILRYAEEFSKIAKQRIKMATNYRMKVISMDNMQRKTVNEKPLEMLDNIESCSIKLSRREQKVVDSIFQNIEEFESLQVRMKNALIEEEVSRLQLLDMVR